MKKILILINIILLSFFTVFSFAAQEQANQTTLANLNSGQSLKNTDQSILEASLDFSTGYRKDKLDWSIAGDTNGENPNILSELTWKDLNIYQVKTNAKLILDKRLRIEGSYGYGSIYEGENQDSDYAGDNRTYEWSRSSSNTEDDNVSDWSIGIGYQFQLDNVEYLSSTKTMLAFLGGYSYHEQNLRDRDGFQIIDLIWDTYGPFDGLNSTYQTEWKGPWLGAEIEGAQDKIVGFLRFEYHWADYSAEADWNLRTTFAHPVSFTHTADGTGSIVSLGTGYNIDANWLIYLKADIQNWKTKAGLDRTFFTNGTTIDTQLNSVNWKSSAVMIGIKCRI